uniref:Uncharacterized protein n=1 Tax=Knipowitschia caucasica TaxID=637954 RepID=A0AAV2J390_KNICA
MQATHQAAVVLSDGILWDINNISNKFLPCFSHRLPSFVNSLRLSKIVNTTDFTGISLVVRTGGSAFPPFDVKRTAAVVVAVRYSSAQWWRGVLRTDGCRRPAKELN